MEIVLSFYFCKQNYFHNIQLNHFYAQKLTPYSILHFSICLHDTQFCPQVWPSGTGKTLASDPFVSGRPAPPVVDQSAAMNLEDNIQVSEKGDVSGTLQLPLMQYKAAKVEGAVEVSSC